MKHTSIAIISSMLLACAGVANAQNQGNQTTGQSNAQNQQASTEVTTDPIPKKFWQVRLSDGGAYMVALSRITSIARHEYIVDGVVRVHEFTISAEGSTIVRFYHMAPVTDKSPSNAGQVVLDRLKGTTQELARRTNNEDQLTKVSKSYPHGTHTHNIEFRLKSIANVDQLYASIQSAWYDGNGTRVRIQNKQ